MTVSVKLSDNLAGLSLGLVEAEQIRVEPSCAELRQYCAEVAERAKAKFESSEYAVQCQELRQLLRFGKFKPTGRSKPAQEYLMRCVVNEGSLPQINAPVDLLNAVSLDFNLPISLLSIQKCSQQLLIERGQTGDQYAFNSAGQVLDLTDLITIYDVSTPTQPRPVGSPVKDSMAGKIGTEDRHVVSIIYAPTSNSAKERCDRARQRLRAGFAEYCAACLVD